MSVFTHRNMAAWDVRRDRKGYITVRLNQRHPSEREKNNNKTTLRDHGSKQTMDT